MITNLTFNNPEFLWLLILVPALVYWKIISSKKSSASLSISSNKGFEFKSLKVKFLPLLDVLRFVSIVLLVIALARPQIVDVSTQTKTSRGIDIVIAVDISSSMLAQDLKPNRLDALKSVAKEFINDRIKKSLNNEEFLISMNS